MLAFHHISFLCFVALISVCKAMEQIQRDLLWKRDKEEGGLHLVAWDSVCKPKEWGAQESGVFIL